VPEKHPTPATRESVDRAVAQMIMTGAAATGLGVIGSAHLERMRASAVKSALMRAIPGLGILATLSSASSLVRVANDALKQSKKTHIGPASGIVAVRAYQRINPHTGRIETVPAGQRDLRHP
jgi:hypothetical protein